MFFQKSMRCRSVSVGNTRTALAVVIHRCAVERTVFRGRTHWFPQRNALVSAAERTVFRCGTHWFPQRNVCPSTAATTRSLLVVRHGVGGATPLPASASDRQTGDRSRIYGMVGCSPHARRSAPIRSFCSSAFYRAPRGFVAHYEHPSSTGPMREPTSRQWPESRLTSRGS